MKALKTCLSLLILIPSIINAQSLDEVWNNPPEESRPWNYWYWLYGAYSKEGVKADLEAMASNGLGGAYQFTIFGPPDKPYIDPSYRQLSPQWWDIWSYSIKEAARLGLKIGLNACDGWALAGGPWITPELSMQVVTWSECRINGGGRVEMQLETPPSKLGWYKDIATFAWPSRKGDCMSTFEMNPTVVSDSGEDISRIARRGNGKAFSCKNGNCFLEFRFDEPFLCRSIFVRPEKMSYQACRMEIQVSDDGVSYKSLGRLTLPRHGWYTAVVPGLTWTVPPVRARYFRLVSNPQGSSPASEDNNRARGFESFGILEAALSSEARIDMFEGKNGEAWRMSPRMKKGSLRRIECIDPERMIDITSFISPDGILRWDAPQGEWTVLRMGCTTNGAVNGPAGSAVGLECDKFNPEAVRLQLDSWIGHLREVVGPEVFSKAVGYIHTDSWECGTQNWSPVFRDEFLRRRGYDIVDYLPVYAGIPLKDAVFTEDVLLDIRKTVSELYADTFCRLVQEYAASIGCAYSAESIAPATLSENMLHYRYCDFPMGEFWLFSPGQDKPTDILDAVSAAHIYGKTVVGAEAFTEPFICWNEHPGMLKAYQDFEYSQGLNRFVFHVNAHNPWTDSHRPGMTLNHFGLFFQRDQTWWKLSKAWMDYTSRCQAMLQQGVPVVDIAVWTGDDLPRRAIHPERLVPVMGDLFGEETVRREKARHEADGMERDTTRCGVVITKNSSRGEDWVNPLRGYAYDSINSDAIVNLAKPQNGRLCLPEGMSYSLLLLPPADIHSPNAVMDSSTSAAIKDLRRGGVKVVKRFPLTRRKLERMGITPDFQAVGENGEYVEGIAFCHRRTDSGDIYFISNHDPFRKDFTAVFRVSGRHPEIWYPVNGEKLVRTRWEQVPDGTAMPLRLEGSESLFVVFRDDAAESGDGGNWIETEKIARIDGPWEVEFLTPHKTVVLDELVDWKDSDDPQIRFYSGTAVYRTTFDYMPAPAETERTFLEFDGISNMAKVTVNSIDCGTLWTPPLRADISSALRRGENRIEIEVANTWYNHLYGVREGEVTDMDCWTLKPLKVKLPLQSGGLVGNVFFTRFF